MTRTCKPLLFKELILAAFRVLTVVVLDNWILMWVKLFTTAILSLSSQGRIGGLSVLQTEAEMGAISSIEKVTPDLKEAEASNASPGNVASDSCIGGVFTPTSQRKELLPGHEADPPQAHFEATRGKVDALKQVGC